MERLAGPSRREHAPGLPGARRRRLVRRRRGAHRLARPRPAPPQRRRRGRLRPVPLRQPAPIAALFVIHDFGREVAVRALPALEDAMAEIWLPNAERIPGESAGAMNGDGSYKILLHSTEGASIEGAVSAYRQHRSWPTLTVDCPRRRVVEHLPLNVAARALRNDPGGADETNRDGTIHVQIELVGFAERPASIGGPDDLEWLGREVIGPIARLTGVPLRSTVDWVAYPASYGKRAAQRLSPTAWDAYSGVLGHQHAPDNDHGDPGR